MSSATDNGLGSALTQQDVVLGCAADSRDEAIRRCGELLVARGSVSEEYVDAMFEREKVVSTYLGNGVALPHGVLESKSFIHSTGIVVTQYPDGVDWGPGTARLVVGLAAAGDDHVRVLSRLAEVLQDEDLCDELATSEDASHVYARLTEPPSDE